MFNSIDFSLPPKPSALPPLCPLHRKSCRRACWVGPTYTGIGHMHLLIRCPIFLQSSQWRRAVCEDRYSIPKKCQNAVLLPFTSLAGGGLWGKRHNNFSVKVVSTFYGKAPSMTTLEVDLYRKLTRGVLGKAHAFDNGRAKITSR